MKMRNAFCLSIIFVFSLICGSEPLAEEVPHASIPVESLLAKDAVQEAMKGAKNKEEIESFYDNTLFTIYCTEWNENGARYQLPPEAGLVGARNMENDEGEFMTIYACYTLPKSIEVNGSKKYVHTFLTIISYDWDGETGAILIPFWAELNRRDPENPKILSWNIFEDKISCVTSVTKEE